MSKINELTTKELKKLYQKTYLEFQRVLLAKTYKEKNKQERTRLQEMSKGLGEIYQETIKHIIK